MQEEGGAVDKVGRYIYAWLFVLSSHQNS